MQGDARRKAWQWPVLSCHSKTFRVPHWRTYEPRAGVIWTRRIRVAESQSLIIVHTSTVLGIDHGHLSIRILLETHMPTTSRHVSAHLSTGTLSSVMACPTVGKKFLSSSNLLKCVVHSDNSDQNPRHSNAGLQESSTHGFRARVTRITCGTELIAQWHKHL